MSLGVAILGLAVLVLVHEAGHFFAARAVGMTPRKFYIGFGPPLVKHVRGGVEYGIAALPLGGYVKIPGMHRPAPGDLRQILPPAEREHLAADLDELDAALERDDETTALAVVERLKPQLPENKQLQELEWALAPDAYWRQSAAKKITVIGAGPAVNIVLAVVLLSADFSFDWPESLASCARSSGTLSNDTSASARAIEDKRMSFMMTLAPKDILLPLVEADQSERAIAARKSNTRAVPQKESSKQKSLSCEAEALYPTH